MNFSFFYRHQVSVYKRLCCLQEMCTAFEPNMIENGESENLLCGSPALTHISIRLLILTFSFFNSHFLSVVRNEAPDPECSKKCANGGWCNQEKICQCPVGYMGQYCKTALCYPQCMNGGFCTAPAVCSCPRGYQGRHCEGGINVKF